MRPPAQPNQSLIDGLACLQALAGGAAPVGVRDLARRLDLEPTRVHRLLKTLAYLGLAEQDARRGYRPGPGVHVLAAQALFGSGLLRRASAPLEGLHRFGLTVALGVLWRQEVAYLYHGGPGVPAAAAIGRAGLFPARQSGLGVALLARRADLRTLDAELRARVQQARAAGYALVETEPGSWTLAVALPGDSAAAVGLAGAIARARVPELLAALRAAADQIAGPSAAEAPTPKSTHRKERP